MRNREAKEVGRENSKRRKCSTAAIRCEGHTKRGLVMLLDGAGLLLLRDVRPLLGVRVLPALEAERLVVDGVEAPEEEEQEDGAGDDIEDAVPDHLARRGDDVRALRQGPADRVGEEHEGEEGRGLDVARAEGTPCGEGAAGAMHEQDVPEGCDA